MYVTRPLSLYKRSPEALAEPPSKGPNSGYLVLQDEESTGTRCFGLCKDTLTTDLPFPQNKRLTIEHDLGDNSTFYPSFFIPVINQPLSANRYYVICAERKHKGDAYASSTEEDRKICCFCCTYIKDQKPRPLDPNDSHQQFEFSLSRTCGNTVFVVESVASNSYPPAFLRNGHWTLWNSEPKHFRLDVAEGLNSTLRNRLPDFNFPLSQDHSEAVTVGKWYTPFMFIKEATPNEQMKRSMFYETTLEQKWERIFYCQNKTGDQGNNIVSFDVVIPTHRVTINGREAEEIKSDDALPGVKWFRPRANDVQEERIGVSLLLMERMKWEQESFGWCNEEEKQVKVGRVEKYEGIGPWEKFGCHLLFERFVFKRADASLALTYDFVHTHQVKIKWEGSSL